MVTPTPIISILMPVYNASLHVETAILSILNQTFTDFELLVFNDGSSDNSSEIIQNIKDERIIFFDNKKNSGYVTHLNEGLRIARGKYIARMDADDIAMPERFVKQFNLLEAKPEIGLCGTSYMVFGAQQFPVTVPLNDTEIREFMLADNPMGHPTIMFRKSLVEQHGLHYNHDFMPAEDYKLWYDFSKISKIENLPEILLNYRVHPHQISSYMNTKQRSNADRVRILQLSDKGFCLTNKEEEVYCKIIQPTYQPQTVTELDEMCATMWKIVNENSRLKAYNPLWFKNRFELVWKQNIFNINKYTPMHLWPIFLKSKPIDNNLGIQIKLKILFKSILFWKRGIA